MLTWLDYAWMPEEKLAAQPIEAVNLASARGLPGAESIDFGYCLSRIDYMAECVRAYTERALPQFRRKRWDFDNSEPYFRVLCLVTALQRDLGVKYNPAKIPEDVPFDSADSFIHGILQGPGGTCATMPVLYAAVGRRLGYPLKLASAYGGKADHLFARWDEPGREPFNIEATAQGLRCPPDDHYRTGRYVTPPEVESAGCFLQSLRPNQELALFLVQRAHTWQDHSRLVEAVDCWCWAAALAPANFIYLNTAKLKMNEWRRQLNPRKPPGFPEIFVTTRQRRYPGTLPIELEVDAIGTEIVEHLLSEPRFNDSWWEPMRRGERPAQAPVSMEVHSTLYHCDYSFRLIPTC
jgi:hypothetical protein